MFLLGRIVFCSGQNSVTAIRVFGLRLTKVNEQILPHKSGPGGKILSDQS